MVAMGAGRILAERAAPSPSEYESLALGLCILGLLGVFAVGYPGYFAFDAAWPSFFYSPVPTGKNARLLVQAFFIAVYFLGALPMFNAVRHALDANAETTASLRTRMNPLGHQ